jgi:putative addiction module component (TIGR02574 family)
MGCCNLSDMSIAKQAVEELYERAAELPPSDRAELAGLLLESIEDPPDEGVEDAWAAEIERRMADYRAGLVRTIPWSEVRAYLHRPNR